MADGEKASSYLQESIEKCNFVMQQFPQDYANDEFVVLKINLTMANNMFLLGKQDEVAQWCSRVPKEIQGVQVPCPQIIPTLSGDLSETHFKTNSLAGYKNA